MKTEVIVNVEGDHGMLNLYMYRNTWFLYLANALIDMRYAYTISHASQLACSIQDKELLNI